MRANGRKTRQVEKWGVKYMVKIYLRNLRGEYNIIFMLILNSYINSKF